MMRTSAAGEPRVVVLDDDPTGTQAAAGVTVLFDADTDAIAEVLAREPSVYLQTNSRALTVAEATRLAREIRSAVITAERAIGCDVRVVLRGDSTLRGHVFTESRVFLDTDAIMLFVPAYPTGGRITRHGIHFVREGRRFVPVARTEFARDPVFGYRSSGLSDFVFERTAARPIVAGLGVVRGGRLAATLMSAPAGSVVVADAADYADIAHVARAVEQTWRTRGVVVRAAAPLAAELAGVRRDALLTSAEVAVGGRALIVCGSHTDLARRQLESLAALIGTPTEIDTALALSDPLAAGARAASQEQRRRRPGGARFISTQRVRSPEHSSLTDGAHVMTALTHASSLLADGCRTVITKGGITAAEVIGRGLGARRARVRGQVEPGVSVWDVESAGGRTVRCIIVPGNMGGADVLGTAMHLALGEVAGSALS